MSGHAPQGIDKNHLLLFGTIAQEFAAYELLIQKIISHLVKAQLGSVILLTRPLAFRERRDVLLDLMHHYNVPVDQSDRVRFFLNVPLTHEALRHAIVHATWTTANRDTIQPNWILNPAPRIKPMLVGADPLPSGIRESEDDKTAYSLDDLTEIAAALNNNFVYFVAYLHEVGLIDP